MSKNIRCSTSTSTLSIHYQTIAKTNRWKSISKNYLIKALFVVQNYFSTIYDSIIIEYAIKKSFLSTCISLELLPLIIQEE